MRNPAEALRLAQRARELTPAGNQSLAREIERRLALYQAGQPYYEPPAEGSQKTP